MACPRLPPAPLFPPYFPRLRAPPRQTGLNHLPTVPQTITTPLGLPYEGVAFQGRICGVSIMRAGEAMENGLRDCCRSGKWALGAERRGFGLTGLPFFDGPIVRIGKVPGAVRRA